VLQILELPCSREVSILLNHLAVAKLENQLKALAGNVGNPVEKERKNSFQKY
jgi:hypothetical protein